MKDGVQDKNSQRKKYACIGFAFCNRLIAIHVVIVDCVLRLTVDTEYVDDGDVAGISNRCRGNALVPAGVLRPCVVQSEVLARVDVDPGGTHVGLGACRRQLDSALVVPRHLDGLVVGDQLLGRRTTVANDAVDTR